jgi:hypothetical protein
MSMSNKIEHLKMIQAIITRMGGNLFILKGWTITLIVGLLTVATKNEEGIYVLFSFFLIAVFWLLDGFFLSIERCYRDLYNYVRNKKEKDIDFSMDYRKYKKDKNTWVCSILSKTLIPFYGSLLVIMLFVTLTLKIKSIKVTLYSYCNEQNSNEIINLIKE